MEKLKEFVIDRSKWLCGAESLKKVIDQKKEDLFDIRSKRSCCLGLYANQCGIGKDILKNNSTIFGLVAEANSHPKIKKLEWLNEHIGNFNTDRVESEFMLTNDDPEISQKERESRLKKAFAKNGVKVKFVGRLLG